MISFPFTYKNDYLIIDIIDKSRASVYKAKQPNSDTIYALKLFPYTDKRPSPEYMYEARFSDLKHPNIIEIIEKTYKKKNPLKGKQGTVSYLVLEYAPYGSFHDLLSESKLIFDEKLTRTYFHQLINGLEYLHNEGIAHLDIKPANLLMGNNYILKICDFGFSYKEGDTDIVSEGTSYYRAPEIKEKSCNNPKAADIYSAGIVLFTIKCNGKVPHKEDKVYHDYQLYELMYKDNEAFWEAHCKLQNKHSNFFSRDFQELFNAMTAANPEDRPDISKIKSFKWYQGPVFDEKELVDYISSNFPALKSQ